MEGCAERQVRQEADARSQQKLNIEDNLGYSPSENKESPGCKASTEKGRRDRRKTINSKGGTRYSAGGGNGNHRRIERINEQKKNRDLTEKKGLTSGGKNKNGSATI